MNYYVYILASATRVTIYVGVTKDLIRRVAEHKAHADSTGFTAQYDVTQLVYYEATPSIYTAISREKQLKSWSRRRKNDLVETSNPSWSDLYPALL